MTRTGLVAAHVSLVSSCIALGPSQRGFSYLRRGFEAFFVIGLGYAIAMVVEDVSVVLGLAGSTGSTAISFILPSLFFCRLHPAPYWSLKKGSAVVLGVLGLIFLFVSTVVTVLAASSSEDSLSLASLCNRTHS